MERLIELIQEHPLLKYSDYKVSDNKIEIQRSNTIIVLHISREFYNEVLIRDGVSVCLSSFVETDGFSLKETVNKYLSDEEFYDNKINSYIALQKLELGNKNNLCEDIMYVVKEK